MQKIARESTKRYSIVLWLVGGLQQIQLGFLGPFFSATTNIHRYVITNSYIIY
jgi:hypothetical protein